MFDQCVSKPHELSCERDKELEIDVDVLALRARRGRMACFIPRNPQNRLDRGEVGIEVFSCLPVQLRRNRR